MIRSLKEFDRTDHLPLGGPPGQLISENINLVDTIDSLANLVLIVNHTLHEINNRADTKHPLANVKGPTNTIPSQTIIWIPTIYKTEKNLMHRHLSKISGPLRKVWWAYPMVSANALSGISQLFLANSTSGFNIMVNLSFKEDIAGLCGLTRAEVEEALDRIRESKTDVKEHVTLLMKYVNGYHFCHYRSSEPVFNTDTSLKYLQARDEFDIASPLNSQVSAQFLGLPDLQSRALGGDNEVAWHTLLVYFGAFTFDKENPSKFVTIPNHITAAHFGTTILCRFGLLGSMRMPLVILENPGLDFHVEYEVTKQGGSPGVVDIVILSASHCVVTEWKTFGIDVLDLGDSLSWDKKAEALSQLDVNRVFDVASQLNSYILSPEIRGQAGSCEFHVHLVLIVGSQKILVGEMDEKGD
ncbi:hypothetical protein HOY80DRAFT_1063168 [Tuber brumale]|nr:hypothetical protein HOY80DRAFT_1063168 [Tuber brumale]